MDSGARANRPPLLLCNCVWRDYRRRVCLRRAGGLALLVNLSLKQVAHGRLPVIRELGQPLPGLVNAPQSNARTGKVRIHLLSLLIVKRLLETELPTVVRSLPAGLGHHVVELAQGAHSPL